MVLGPVKDKVATGYGQGLTRVRTGYGSTGRAEGV